MEGFAREYLKVKYVFWGMEEPFYSKEVVGKLRGGK
jgi:hypothetical protein